MRLLILILFCIYSTLHGATILPNQPDNLFIIDDFEDADLERFPEWWGFDNISLSIEPNNPAEFSALEERSLQITGPPENWYVGGCGTYFGIDVSEYNSIKLLVKGYGPKSAVLIVELFDDDNNNYEVEPHPEVLSETLYDDKFIHTIKVDWYGWKVVIIPFNKFVDANLTIGDDIWNPFQKESSGGLLQMQLVLLAADKSVTPRLQIDTIKLYHQKEIDYSKKTTKQESGFSDF
tara:strand:- start:346 stop:1050 length:705 start_codon:yes stop_codon:yes gene_type:complete